MSPVRYGGIFAAGEGSRLAARYPSVPKPLVPVAGKPLIHWAVAALRSAGVRRLTVLLNSRGGGVRDYLRAEGQGLEISFLSRDTASSYESFRLLSRTLARKAARFLLSTADTILAPEDAARFAREAFAPGAAAGLALTRFVDDEKPLWAELGRDGFVKALGPAAARDAVTCGLYAFTARAARRFPEARAYGRLRDFLADMVRSGAPVKGVLLSEALDVDRPEDVAAAEERSAWYAA